MTNEDLQIIARQVGSVGIGDTERLADLIFDEIERQHTPQEVAIIGDILYNYGIDTGPICRKKHPPAPPPHQ